MRLSPEESGHPSSSFKPLRFERLPFGPFWALKYRRGTALPTPLPYGEPTAAAPEPTAPCTASDRVSRASFNLHLSLEEHEVPKPPPRSLRGPQAGPVGPS